MDTLGLILVVMVTAANVSDQVGLRQLLQHYLADGFKRLRHRWVDGGYHGEPLASWVAGLKVTDKIVLEVVENTLPGFHLVKRRWVVEGVLSPKLRKLLTDLKSIFYHYFVDMVGILVIQHRKLSREELFSG